MVANQRPFPPFHGANADIWRILLALRRTGLRIVCVGWRDVLAGLGPPPAELLAQVERYVELPMDVSATGSLLRPYFVEARRPNHDDLRGVVEAVKAAGCRGVLAIGLYGADLARTVAQTLALPFFYRSHAIETEYHRQHYRLSRTDADRRTALRNAVQLRAIAQFERTVIGDAEVVFEISSDDIDNRLRRHAKGFVHLPPLAPTARETAVTPWTQRKVDVAYLGNLFMPNNIVGIRWFLEEVVPHLQRARRLRVVIAGKVGDRSLIRELAKSPVEVIADPPDADTLLAGVRVGVNPIFSGNGTTVKTIDLLWAGCGVVSTPIGLQGYSFPFDRRLPVRLATNSRTFAGSIVQLLDRPPPDPMTTRQLLADYSQEHWGPQIRGFVGL